MPSRGIEWLANKARFNASKHLLYGFTISMNWIQIEGKASLLSLGGKLFHSLLPAQLEDKSKKASCQVEDRSIYR
jgi:hypothetical protein